MHDAKLGTIVLAGLVGVGACSLAGLDDYASGQGGNGAQGSGGDTSSGSTTSGHTTGTHSTGGTSTGSTSTTTMDCGDLTRCGEVCTDPSSDAKNCGDCGVACPDDYACISGVCGNVPVDVSTSLTTCVVLLGGEVWCWGRNLWGEVGINPSTTSTTCPFYSDKCQTTPARVSGIGEAVQVAVGGEATCARTKVGEVWCWGSNAKGLLGHNPIDDPLCSKAGGPNSGTSGRCNSTPQKVALPQNVVADDLVMGSVVACVHTTTRDVYCWGSNGNGEIQTPASGSIIWQPTKNSNVNGDAEQVVVSTDRDAEYGTLCYREKGNDNVQCWGQSVGRTLFVTANSTGCKNSYCNPNAKRIYDVFQQPGNPVLADSIGLGWRVGCAIRSGVLHCWGDDTYGQSGVSGGGLGGDHFDPMAVPGISGAVAVSNRFATTLILDDTRSVWALGWAGEGQIGDGSFGEALCPNGNGQLCVSAAKKLSGLPPIAKVVAGTNNSAAITDDHRLFMWGSNYTAALGHAPGASGDTSCAEQPMQVCNPVPAVVTGLP